MNDSMWYRLISNITFIHLIDPFYCRVSFISKLIQLCVNAASYACSFNCQRSLYSKWFKRIESKIWNVILFIAWISVYGILLCFDWKKREKHLYILAMNEWTVYNVCNVYPNMPKVLMENHMHSPFLHRTTIFSLSWLSTARMWMCNIKKFFLPYFKLFYRYRYY